MALSNGDSSAYTLMLLLAGHCLITESNSKPELLYDWWFTANQFIFAPSPLRLMTRDFFFIGTLSVIVLM
jgi:hypothetical protein